MGSGGLGRWVPLAVGGALLALLAMLATLQYRWIGQVSILESQRLRGALLGAGAAFAEDFDREVTRAFVDFRPAVTAGPVHGADGALAARVAHQYAVWRAEAPFPGLIRDIFHVDDGAGGAADGLALAVLRRGPPRFEAVAWPPEMADLRRRLGEGGDRGGGSPPPVAPEAPGLVIPAWGLSQDGAAVEWEHLPGSRTGGFLIVRFDAAAIASEVLPELTRRHFGSLWGVHDAVTVAVVEAAGALRPRVIFVSDPALPAGGALAGDLALPMFSVRHFAEHGGAAAAGEEHRGFGEERMGGPPEHRGPRGMGGPDAEPRGERGAWTLVVRRRGGSLEAMVAGFRRRNLMIGAGIVALAAVTTALMTVATQRAQQLARQQMEFVAAVTHELNTPLTAIRSAGQNLADGVVAEPAQVRRYGELILGEGRRLSRLVAQVLDFAGIESGHQSYFIQATDLREVVAGALEDCAALLAERRARVESLVAAAELPAVSADAAALRRALRNLIENAAKYGGPEPWIGIAARSAGGEVAITVEDRGPGIRREDLPHLFEPFFRGHPAAGATPPGSGLGLSVVRSIVQAHRGRVTCTSGGARQGSAFTLYLPTAAGRAT